MQDSTELRANQIDYDATPGADHSLRDNLLTGALLALILVIGAYFRFVGQNWDDFTHLHPDERFLTQVADNLGGPLQLTDKDPTVRDEHMQTCLKRYPESSGVGPIFDSECSNWYPNNVGHGLYVYGELPLFVVKISAILTSEIHSMVAQTTPDPADDVVAASWTGYNGIHLIGRNVSAVADLFSIVLVFLIGRKLYNRRVGLLGAALYAAAVFPIQLSHFWTTDAFTNLPVLLAFWFAVRAMDGGHWQDFVGFGIGMGAALASRINTLPLFGVIILAAMIYALPALDRFLSSAERWRLITRAGSGIILAVIFTLAVFRVTNPHAFVGGSGPLGILNLVHIEPSSGGLGFRVRVFYEPFLDDVGEAQYLTSGKADFPPNHQWASRTPYVFPWWNITMWGLGLPFGLAAWFGVGWCLWQTLRNRPGWTRHALLLAWIVVYFGYMGRQWVMTMRYFMPLYPFLALVAAWALLEVFERARRWAAANPSGVRRLASAGGTVLLVGVLLAANLWAVMFTSIYRRELTRVEASQWVLRNLPASFSTTVTGVNGITRLVQLPANGYFAANIVPYKVGDRQITAFVPGATGTADRVIVNRVLDPDRTGQRIVFHAAVATDGQGVQVVAQGKIEADFGATEDRFGGSVTIPLDQPVALIPARSYFLVTWADAPVIASRKDKETADFTLGNGNNEALAQVRLPDVKAFELGQASVVLGDTPVQVQFKVPIAGTIDRIDATHVISPLHDSRPITLVAQVLDPAGNTVLAQGTLSVSAVATGSSPLGEAYSIKLDKTLNVEANRQLLLSVTTSDGAPLQVTGTAIATEGPWDDAIPYKVCALPPEIELTHDTPPGLFDVATCQGVDVWGSWYRGLELFMAAEDDQQKRSTMQKVLDEADYITISSNRFYDTLTRIPTRFPMSIDFYDALWSGNLGFDITSTVTSTYSLGSLEIPDQNLPTYHTPKWINEWESEEAFSVYDHPTVFIFKKNPDLYDPLRTASVLNNSPLNDASVIPYKNEDPTLVNVIRWGAQPASSAPTGFMMPPDLRDIQTQGGTWSELFNRNWLINASPFVGVVAWWLVICLIGFIVWPLLFVLFPGLPDRGYPLIKIAGLLIVSWIVWVGGTLRFLVWSQAGIALTILVVGLLGLWIGYRRRAELLNYMRLNWRHLVIIEAVTFLLFIAFVFVRMGNPDLWAQTLGGEKPMNFAYFNAVLRSTVFPPYDPWYAGGYLNYYYYGYVLVGTPLKLLGMVPAVAYNLIVPTLFALTGIGAFSVSFNLVASRWFFPRDEGRDEKDAPLPARRRFALRVPPGSPYVAGALGLVLCVVLGNLDTPRTFFNGIAKAGGCREEMTDLYTWKVTEFMKQNSGRPPSPAESTQMLDESAHPSLGDQIGYGWFTLQRGFSCFGNGLNQAFESGVLPISPERWFWGPRSIVTELPNSAGEIAEMPYFTFVYADLHAHMLALPITLLAISWLLAEVLIAGQMRRPTWIVILATALGGLAVGILRPTNSWDWITYLVLGMVGLLFAIYLRRERLTRHTGLAWVGQVGWFFAAQTLAALPFLTYFATSYNAARSFEGNKTPIWVYLTIHGLFLFIIVSLLAWQTSRLLQRLYVRDFVGRAWSLLLVATGLAAVALVTLIFVGLSGQIWLFDFPFPVALIALPLIAWCGLLFLVPDQSRELRIVYALTALALAVSLGVEIVVLEGDIGRQNTFFKFYMQVWVLFSVVGGAALAWMLHASERWRSVVRAPWLGFLTLLLFIAALFPIMGTQGKIAMRMAPQAPQTLDGLAYMRYATYYEGSTPMPLGDDLDIIDWLQDNVKGTPAIIEAHQYPSEYRLNGRISISTGLPTVLGWRFHQQQQRTLDPLPNLVVQRGANVISFYNTPDIGTAWRMLKFFDVQYIIVAKLERATYAPEGLAKFDQMVELKLLEVVYDKNGGDRIYRVNPTATYVDTQLGRNIQPVDVDIPGKGG